MECSKIQRLALEGKLSAAAERHVKECLGCRVFADSLDRFVKAKPDYAAYIPPERLDAIVRSEAEKRLAILNAEDAGEADAIEPRARSGWMVWLSAAACLALAAWVAVASLFHGRQARGVATAARVDTESCAMAVDWNGIDMREDFFDLQIQIELDMAAIHASQRDDADSGADGFSEPPPEEFSLPPIWS
jgi:hypothetical protein